MINADRPMETDKWKSVVISIDSYARLKALAKAERRTLSGQFTWMLDDYLGGENNDNKTSPAA
jgi:macrodomain Ter protein organizer (MatP/YcbG family)